MIILSQSKKELTDDLNIKIIPEIGEGIELSGYSLINGKNIDLGFYGTEERAKEVLMEIVIKYNRSNNIYEGYVENVVYEMPEK